MEREVKSSVLRFFRKTTQKTSKNIVKTSKKLAKKDKKALIIENDYGIL
ncbi:MAG: hypothetical protein IIY81_06435 [Lachnospiraceae bacterium]|nr:hypothetical protein [Lachnospiraceae bacterium]